MIIKSLEEKISDVMMKYLFETANDDTCIRLMLEVLPLVGQGKNLVVLYDVDTHELSVSYDADNEDRKTLTLSEGMVIEE